MKTISLPLKSHHYMPFDSVEKEEKKFLSLLETYFSKREKTAFLKRKRKSVLVFPFSAKPFKVSKRHKKEI